VPISSVRSDSVLVTTTNPGERTPSENAMHALLVGLSETDATVAIEAVNKHIAWLPAHVSSETEELWKETLTCLLNAALREDTCSDHICKTIFGCYRRHENLRPLIEQYAYDTWQFVAMALLNRPSSPSASLADRISTFDPSHSGEILYLAGAHAYKKEDVLTELLIHETLAAKNVAFRSFDSKLHDALATGVSELRRAMEEIQGHMLWCPEREVSSHEMATFFHHLGWSGTNAKSDEYRGWLSQRTLARPLGIKKGNELVTVLDEIKTWDCKDQLDYDDAYFRDDFPGIAFAPLFFERHWSLLVIDSNKKHAAIFDSNPSIPTDDNIAPTPYQQSFNPKINRILESLRITHITVVGGAIQQWGDNACGPLVAHSVKRMVSGSPDGWFSQLDTATNEIGEKSVESSKHLVAEMRLEMLGHWFETTRAFGKWRK